MKKILLYFLFFMACMLTWYGESRKFFNLKDGNCVTLWKTYNNVCYIIPGYYFGIIYPSGNFLKTTNTNNVTIFFSKKLPNSIIYFNDGSLPITVVNGSYAFYDYSIDKVRFDKLLYKPNARNANDINSNVDLIDLYIPENYATDKNAAKQ